MRNANLCIIKVGSTFPEVAKQKGDFEHWIQHTAGVTMTVIDPRDGTRLPSPDTISGAIITGSGNMVTERLPWSERSATWLAALVAREIPVLGICYGHQLLAHALGGTVDYHPGGMEIGTVPVSLMPTAATDPLFGDLPETFPAHTVHSQSIRQLPAGAVILASGRFEPVQAFRVGSCAWGVQFHPEFNLECARAYVRELAPVLQKQHWDLLALERQLKQTPIAASLLPRFVQLVEDSRCKDA